MEQNPGIEAVRKLAHMGYRFTISAKTIKASYEGQGEPDPRKVRPLLEALKAHKDKVRFFLQCHCPRCGGVVFGTFADGESRCLVCYYKELNRLFPGPKP
jgi:hypothetical protein